MINQVVKEMEDRYHGPRKVKDITRGGHHVMNCRASDDDGSDKEV